MKERVIAGVMFLVWAGMAGRVTAADAARPGSEEEQPAIEQLSDKQLAELVTDYTDKKTGRSFRFTASLRARQLSPLGDWMRIREYRKSGKVPFIVTAELSEYKEINGRTRSKRIYGTAHIYILDQENKVVNRADVPLATLCPG